MVLAERVIKGASLVPEGQRLPFEESLLGGRGSMGLLSEVPPGSTVSLGLAFGVDESLQCDTARLHLSTHPRGGWIRGMWFWIQLLWTGREFNPELLLILEDPRGCYSNLMPAGKRQTPPKLVLWPTASWQQRVPIRQGKSSREWYPLEFICFVLSGQREREWSDRRVGPAASSWISEILA